MSAVRRRAGPLAYVRSALFAGWMFGSAVGLGLVCLPLMLGSPRTAMIPIRLWARGQLPGGAYLLASKHQSMLDTLVAMTLTPWPCIVLKKELMWIPIFGWYAARAQMIVIDRAGGLGDVRQLLAAARKALADGRQVLIYPEGTRRSPGAEPAYKGGAGLLYKDLGVACVPIATNAGVVWPAHGLLKHQGAAVFEVLEPIAPGAPRKTFMNRLESGIEAASNRLLSDAG